MNEDVQKLIESGKLNGDAAAKLEQLQPGGFCNHKSWGFGSVAEWNLLTGQIFIDFKGKKGHPMQLQYAAETLTPILPDHVRARIAMNASAVRARAKEEPAELAKQALADLGGKATVDQLAELFVPECFDAAGFKRFWDAAKKKLKSDGHVHLPAKKSEPILLHDAPVKQSAKLFTRFRDARHPKDQVAALESILKALDDLAQEVEEMKALAERVEEAASKGQRLHSTQAVELLLARDEICSRHDALQPGDGAPTVADILVSEESRLGTLFSELPASKHRRVLQSMKTAFGDAWASRSLRLASQGSTRLVQEVARLFESEGALPEFGENVHRWIRERSVSPEALFWLCKERGGPFPHLFSVDLFSAVLSALERDLLGDIKRGTKLHDLMMDDKELLGDLLAGAEPDEVRDAVRKLKLTPAFDDLNKRSLLARIIKLHPEIQAMVMGDQDRQQDESLVVSWASLERRRLEFEDLVNRQIPQNTRDISIARSYGDLRENFEFKAAKEQQRVLMRRKSEAERELANARGTNFEDVDTSKVSIGSIVTLMDLGSGASETYSILGAWDSLPEQGIVSYKAAIGQSLLGKAVGETAELPTETGARTVRVEAIEVFKNLELLGAASQSPV
jgi:transcription elongation GreA/GreB family factor